MQELYYNFHDDEFKQIWQLLLSWSLKDDPSKKVPKVIVQSLPNLLERVIVKNVIKMLTFHGLIRSSLSWSH